MESVTCNLCGSDNTSSLFKKKDKLGTIQIEFNVVECQRCGLLYVNPRPDQGEIGKFYPEVYSWKETLKADSLLTKWIRQLENFYRYHLLRDEVSKVIRFIGKQSGKVLDIGCGTGDRLHTFRSRGFDVQGVEPSPSAMYAKEFLKLNVFKGDLFSAHFQDNFFDIITLYHTLEHTHDPMKVCQEIFRILKEGGFLIIQVPNKDCFQFKLFRERWAAFDVPRDLYYFGIQTLLSYLNKVGFKIIKIDHFMNWWHPPTLVLSLFPSLDPQRAWREEEKGRNSIFQRVAWIVSTLLASPFTLFESWIKRGAIVTFYAVREQ
jgi:SAM-dependent methyltransferase